MDANVAFALAGAGLGTGVVGEDGGGVVALVAALGAELGGEEGVAAGGVEDVAGRDGEGAFGALGLDGGAAAVGGELDVGDAGVLHGAGAAVGGGLEQEGVELGPADLPGAGEALVERVGEGEVDGGAGVVGDELGTGLVDADGGDLVDEAEALEELGVAGEQAFADVEAGVAGFFDEEDVVAGFGEEEGGGGAGGAGADDQDVAGEGVGHAMPPLMEIAWPVI